MIPGTVGARHPRPKPNEEICCTSDRQLQPDRTKFRFLMDNDRPSVSGHRRVFAFF